MKSYQFRGWEQADAAPVDPKYAALHDPRELYDSLTNCWSKETCAPRLREKWSVENPTVGQCSITAFLAQDIFGGRVYGIPLPEGGYHCFNVIQGKWFDLTSEQFGEDAKNLDYEHCKEQFREDHFADEDKRQRYELLKTALLQVTGA